MMMCKDNDPKNEQIINMLLNNGQVTKRQLNIHQKYAKMTHTEYTTLYDKNRANIRMLNNMNKTALYYASKNRKKKFGWNQEIGNIMDYDKIVNGDNRSQSDLRMQRLQKKVRREEQMLEQHEARRKNSKQPNSLTLEQEDRARARFLNNKITKAISDQQK